MTRAGGPARGRGVALVLVAAAVVLAGPGAREAAAHAGLVRADPVAGAALGAAPPAVRLTFSERAEPSLSDVRVLDRAGVTRQTGPPTAVPGDPSSLQVPLRALRRGVYTVTWRSLSAVDGHATAGSFAFGVREKPTGDAAGSTSTNPGGSGLEMLARFVLILGLVALLGAAVAGLAGFAGSTGSELRLAGVGWLLAAIGLAGLFDAQRRSAGAPVGELLDSDIGAALIQRAAAIVAAGLALIAAWRWHPAAALALGRADGRRARLAVAGRWRAALAVVAVATAAAMAAHVAAGHAAAGGWPRAIAQGAQWAHFAAAAIWIGGLAALLLGLRGEPSREKAAAVRRFAFVALGGLAVVAAAGTLRAVDELGAVGELWSTGYGRAILAKVALLALIAVIAARRRRGWRTEDRGSRDEAGSAADRGSRDEAGNAADRGSRDKAGSAADRGSRDEARRDADSGSRAAAARPAEDLGALRRTARAELVLAGAAFALAAVLGTIAPPVAGDTAPQGLRATGADFATTTRVTLTTASSEPGANRFTVRVADYDSGEPVRGARITLRFAPLDDPDADTTSLQLAPQRNGSYAATGANLAFDGRWKVIVVVQRASDAVEVPLELEVPSPEHFISVQRVSGLATQYTAQLIGTGYVRIAVDPERAGPNTVTVTVFTVFEDFADVDTLILTTTGPVRRHPLARRGRTFVGRVALAPGANTIVVVAHVRGGARLRAVFDLDVAR